MMIFRTISLFLNFTINVLIFDLVISDSLKQVFNSKTFSVRGVPPKAVFLYRCHYFPAVQLIHGTREIVGALFFSFLCPPTCCSVFVWILPSSCSCSGLQHHYIWGTYTCQLPHSHTFNSQLWENRSIFPHTLSHLQTDFPSAWLLIAIYWVGKEFFFFFFAQKALAMISEGERSFGRYEVEEFFFIRFWSTRKLPILK